MLRNQNQSSFYEGHWPCLTMRVGVRLYSTCRMWCDFNKDSKRPDMSVLASATSVLNTGKQNCSPYNECFQ